MNLYTVDKAKFFQSLQTTIDDMDARGAKVDTLIMSDKTGAQISKWLDSDGKILGVKIKFKAVGPFSPLMVVSAKKESNG